MFEYAPTMPVGENRERLRQESRGEYICFVDDDDLVPPDYVSCILPLLDGVDYVGFNVEQRVNDSFHCIEQRSLRFNGVSRDNIGGYFRDLSHLNPMRRQLALQVPMHGFPEEDTRWANGIRDLGIVKTEHYIDHTLYYYLFRTDKPEDRSQPAISTEVYPWLMKRTKVKMCISIAGNADPNYDQPEFGYAPGQVVEVHPILAEAWIASGTALRLEPKEEPPEPPVPAPEVPDVPADVVEPALAATKGRVRK